MKNMHHLIVSIGFVLACFKAFAEASIEAPNCKISPVGIFTNGTSESPFSWASDEYKIIRDLFVGKKYQIGRFPTVIPDDVDMGTLYSKFVVSCMSIKGLLGGTTYECATALTINLYDRYRTGAQEGLAYTKEVFKVQKTFSGSLNEQSTILETMRQAASEIPSCIERPMSATPAPTPSVHSNSYAEILRYSTIPNGTAVPSVRLESSVNTPSEGLKAQLSKPENICLQNAAKSFDLFRKQQNVIARLNELKTKFSDWNFTLYVDVVAFPWQSVLIGTTATHTRTSKNVTRQVAWEHLYYRSSPTSADTNACTIRDMNLATTQFLIQMEELESQIRQAQN